MKVGDLVRIYDPDEHLYDGTPYTTVGLLIEIQHKSPGGWRIFKVHAEGQIMSFDEPFWAAEIINSYY